LASALDGREWSASSPCRFTLKERAAGIHWIGGWVGPRAVLDAVVKRKIPSILPITVTFENGRDVLKTVLKITSPISKNKLHVMNMNQ
jgi:hypothetical protein